MIERAFIQQAIRKVELENYLKKQLNRAGFTRSEIVKTPLVTRIVVHVTHPGLAIGKGGQNIKTITETIEKNFKIENPQIEIREILVPELDAQAQSDKLKSLIERGFSWRSIAYRVVRDIMSKRAQGVELVLSGKLAGKGGRKRKQRIIEGYMKKVGHQASWVDAGKSAAYPKAGAIGIKLRIVHPDTVFPDKVRFEDFLGDATKAVEKKEEKVSKNKEEKVSKKPVKKEEKSSEKKGE